MLSLIFVLFYLIKLNSALGISNIFFLEILFQLMVILSTLYIVTFLPTYPIFFVILKTKEFRFLEKLNLTIVSNLSFYILTGYIGFMLGFPITAIFFFIVLVVFFISLILYILVAQYRYGTYKFLRTHDYNPNDKILYENSKKFSFKSLIQSNKFLLIVFLFLICVLNVVRFTYFFGTDPFLHIFLIKSIAKMRYLPLEEYYGSVGLPIFGVVIYFFSGVDIILIPKFFIFYTIPVSALVFYNLLKRIFKNTNLSIFGVFILEFSGLGFAYMMYQFWPSHLVIIQMLTIFLLLYIRLEKFIQLKRPTKDVILADITLNYILISIIFITAILTHALTSIILLLSFVWVVFIYFVKDYRRGIDFILLISLVGIYLLFHLFGFSSEFFFFLDESSFSFMFILALIGIGLGGTIFVWKLRQTLNFTKGRFKLVIIGKKYSYYKTVEDKLIIPLILGIVAFLTILLLIGNFLIFKLPITIVFAGAELLLLISFGIWGIIVFQKKPKGKIFFIWIIFFAFFFISVFIFDMLTNNAKYWARVFFMMPPLIVIGFIAYVYKTIRTGSINTKRTKYFITFLIAFSLITTYTHEYFTVQYVSLTKRQVGGAVWYSKHTEDKNVIITEFGFSYMFMYYDYPYNEGDTDVRGRHIHIFIDGRNDDLFEPDEHEDELKEIKEEEETDVVITPDDRYYDNDGWDTYGYVDEEEEEEYYKAKYLNRIYSAKSEDGTSNPYYWVI